MTLVKLELFLLPGESPWDLLGVLRRLLLWSILCWAAAAPAIGVAKNVYSGWGMVTAVLLFSMAYTLLSGLAAAQQLAGRAGMRRALRTVFWVRLGMTVVFPVGLAFDLIVGIATVFSLDLIDLKGTSFVPTLVGSCLHAIVSSVVLYALCLLLATIFRRSDASDARGFEVLPATPPAGEKAPPPLP
jgi:hypothetical protein